MGKDLDRGILRKIVSNQGGEQQVHGDMSTMVDVVDAWKGVRNVEMTELSPMRYPRTVHATAATGHHIFVFGGYADTLIITCEGFNTTTNT